MPFKSGQVMAVIYPPKGMEEEKAPSYLSTACELVLKGFPIGLSIIHRPEPKSDVEEDKFYHAHLILDAKEAFNKDEWLAEIAVLCNAEIIQISVKPISNMVGALRYLIHADQPTKIQYRKEDVKTTSPDVAKTLHKALQATPKPSVAELLDIKTKTALASRVGPENYAKYVRVWGDLHDEAKTLGAVEIVRKKYEERLLKIADDLKAILDDVPEAYRVENSTFWRVHKVMCACLGYVENDDGETQIDLN